GRTEVEVEGGQRPPEAGGGLGHRVPDEAKGRHARTLVRSLARQQRHALQHVCGYRVPAWHRVVGELLRSHDQGLRVARGRVEPTAIVVVEELDEPVAEGPRA